MKPLDPLPDITVKIGTAEIPLRRRCGALVKLIALHQQSIESTPSLKVIFDCGPSDIALTVAPKLARIKVRR